MYGYDDIAKEAAARGPGFDIVVVEGEMDKLAVDAALWELRRLEEQEAAAEWKEGPELTEEEHVVLARFRSYRAAAVSVPNGAFRGRCLPLPALCPPKHAFHAYTCAVLRLRTQTRSGPCFHAPMPSV